MCLAFVEHDVRVSLRVGLSTAEMSACEKLEIVFSMFWRVYLTSLVFC